MAQADAVRLILAEADLDEPFDHGADLIFVSYIGEEPIGLMAGRTVPQQNGGPPIARLEHIIVRPRWRRGRWVLRVAEGWRELCVSRGITRAVCGIPRKLDRALIIKIAAWWGFRKYAEDPARTWWVKELTGGQRVLRD